jgi:hypothetical protein
LRKTKCMCVCMVQDMGRLSHARLADDHKEVAHVGRHISRLEASRRACRS